MSHVVQQAICHELSSEIVVLKDCLDELDETYQYYLVESAKEEAEAKAKAEATAAAAAAATVAAGGGSAGQAAEGEDAGAGAATERSDGGGGDGGGGGGGGDESDDEDGEWSELDGVGVQYAVALLKVGVKTAGKILEFLVKTPPSPTVATDAPDLIAAECKLAALTAELGKHADDMAAESYPPINPGDMKPAVASFNAHITAISKAMAELATTQNPGVDVPKWVAFLDSATVHNFTKLDAALSGSIGGMGLRTNAAC